MSITIKKGCSTSLVNTELQIEPTRHTNDSNSVHKYSIPSIGGETAQEFSRVSGGSVNRYNHYLKSARHYALQLNIHAPYDLATQISGIHTRGNHAAHV